MAFPRFQEEAGRSLHGWLLRGALLGKWLPPSRLYLSVDPQKGFKVRSPPEEPPCSGLHLPGSLPSQLVSTEDALLQQLAESMLKEDCASELRV